MAPPPTLQIPGMDQVIANLRSIPVITGKAEQFIGLAGSGPPNLANFEQYADLEIPERAVSCTAFEAFDHSQLVANVDPIHSESSEAFRLEWANATNKVIDTFETFATTIGAAIAEKWTGPTGEAVATSIVGYVKNSAKMADASNLIARQVGLLSGSLDRTKTNVPPEPAATVPGKIFGFLGADGWDDDRREAAKAQAVQVLNTVYYGSGISPTAQSMPVFPAVQSPVNDSADPPGTIPTGGPTGGPFSPGAPMAGDGGGGGTPVGPSADQKVPTQAGAPTGDGSDSAAATNAASAPGAVGSDALRGLGSLESPFKPPASTQAAGVSGMGGVGGAGGLGSGVGGASVGSGIGGIGAGASPASPASPTPGSGVAGSAGVPGGARPTVAGQAGMRGMGMAPMGGARGAGGGDDDDEHTTPDYLQNDELRQWVDEQSDRGYAPVIGAQRPPRPNDTVSKPS